MFQLIPSITFGNQKWKGAVPIFNINVKEIIIGHNSEKYVIWKEKLLIIIKEIIKNNIIEDDRAWIIKYLIEDSEDIKLLFLIIKGIKDNKLISNPIQILNHELAEIVMIVPKVNIKIKNIFDKLLNIKKKRFFFIVRVWT